MARTSFDYIVVGAGTSGCVVAGRLSEQARVLLIEAGGPGHGTVGEDDLAEIIGTPDNAIRAAWHPHLSKLFLTVRQRHLRGKRVVINRGAVFGGSGAVNGMIYVRGNRRDYETWAQLGNDGWGYDDVLPLFKRSERFDPSPMKYAPADLAMHGTGGPVAVRPLPDPSALAEAFVAGACELGYTGGDFPWDFNGRRQDGGAGLYQVTVTPEGRRASTARAYIDGPGPRDTLTIAHGASVTRILVDQGRAVGVECMMADGQQGRTFHAEREVILCAGAFDSPKLLMLSGIGPADDLDRTGIVPLVDLPGVGDNLQDHVMILIYCHPRLDPGGSRFTAEAGLFLNTRQRPGSVSPDLQFHVLARMPPLPDVLHGKLPLPDDYFIVIPTLVKPQSRGRATLRSDDPKEDLLIQPNYLSCEEDVTVLAYGIALMRDLLATRSLDPFVDHQQPPFGIPMFHADRLPLPPPSQPAAVREFITATSRTVWHPVGTCRMGRDRLAVVTPDLRVRGVDGLRVADASVMPLIPSGNVNAACIMIGEKCADLVRA